MKKKILGIGAAVLILSAAVFAGCGLTGTRIRFGAAGLGGTYHVFADTFAGLITAGKEKCTVEVKTTAGSAANLRLLSDGYIQMAVAQNDLTNDAYYAVGTFENSRKYRGYSAVAALYTESCQIVVRADSGIESMDDLQGKTVSVGEDESGTELNAEQILAVSGLTDKLIDKVHLDYTEAAERLADGKIDAFFCTAGAETTVISELSKQCEICLLELDESTRDKLLNSYTFYTESVIPKGTYNNQTEDIHTVGVKAVLLVSDKLPEKTVKALTKTLFENKQELQYALPVNIVMNEQTATEGITIPFHKGAAAYYKECGIDVVTGKGSR